MASADGDHGPDDPSVAHDGSAGLEQEALDEGRWL